MPADCKALAIVTAFLSSVMLGFWIAHACALYHGQQPILTPQHYIGMLPPPTGSGGR